MTPTEDYNRRKDSKHKVGKICLFRSGKYKNKFKLYKKESTNHILKFKTLKCIETNR